METLATGDVGEFCSFAGDDEDQRLENASLQNFPRVGIQAKMNGSQSVPKDALV